MMTRIAVLDDWQGVARANADWSALEARAELVFFSDPFIDEDHAAAALTGFEILLTMRERTRIPASLIARLPQLRMIGITGVANAALDMEACERHGIVVCNTGRGPAGAPFATAELALGLLIAAARAIPQGDAAIRAGGFQRGVPVGIGLAGKTLGIIGLGRLGTRMARYGAALDMNVIAWSPNLTAARAHDAGVDLVDKETMLAQADAVSLHLVLSPRTRGLIGAAEIGRMKPGAILINTSRGPLVDEAALLAALRAGAIVAALDVFDTEPPAPDHPLRRCPNCVLTPHLGYAVAETWRAFYPRSVENALAFLDGTPQRVISGKGA
jgi:phosphoglycerate dehydrogenase-like enzyme